MPHPYFLVGVFIFRGSSVGGREGVRRKEGRLSDRDKKAIIVNENIFQKNVRNLVRDIEKTLAFEK